VSVNLTTRTSDRIANMAALSLAITDALYAAGYRDEAREMETAAHKLATIAASVEAKIEAYARQALTGDPA
jgi:hypothetical protein